VSSSGRGLSIEGEQSQPAMKNTFERIEQSEARLRKIIDAIPALVWCGLPDGSMEFFNQRWHDYTGLSSEEAHGWGWKVTIHQITDAIPQKITVLAPDGTALYVNRVALDETGLTLEEVRAGGFFSQAFHPDDVNRVRAERHAGLLRGTPFELEMRARRKGGQYRWHLIQYDPLRDEHGRIIRWYATGADIEDRKRAEEALRSENLALREEIDHASMFEEIIGSSEALHTVLRQVAKVAPTDSTVLILGETGTGKELIARAIHKRSNRATRAFIRVNCAAIPPALLASELFGHEKGAFTGATERRLGRFEAANGGTIFLDEIGDLPADGMWQTAIFRKRRNYGSEHRRESSGDNGRKQRSRRKHGAPSRSERRESRARSEEERSNRRPRQGDYRERR
jgi:PAS domain S-box-containing protein